MNCFKQNALHPNNACRMVNNVYPDQTAQEQSDLDQHCSQRYICSESIRLFVIGFLSVLGEIYKWSK